MALPCLVSEGVAHGASPAEVYSAVPVLIGRGFSLFLDIAEGGKFPSGVVEHGVNCHTDPMFVALVHEICKIFICPQPPVHQAQIPGVIAVACGFKDRTDIKGGAAQIPYVGDPLEQLIKTTGCGGFMIRLRSSQEPQRVDVIKNCFLIPGLHSRSDLL